MEYQIRNTTSIAIDNAFSLNLFLFIVKALNKPSYQIIVYEHISKKTYISLTSKSI